MGNKYRKKIGAYGEGIATAFLVRKRYGIIARNVYLSHQEIDIIAKIRDITVFIEVKTRVDSMAGEGEFSVGYNKSRNLKKAIMAYSARCNINLDKTRFDVIVVNISRNNKMARIKHYIEIF